ncbi:MAG: SH3 domain-containing protein [Candidatus Cloacimonadaceae bacterium]
MEAPRYLALSENPPLVSPDLRRPGFWISRHPAPDSLLMNPDMIAAFNRRILRKGDVGQITQSSAIIGGSLLKRHINDCYNMAKGHGNFRQDGSATDTQFWQTMREATNLKAIRNVNNCRFAFPMRYTNQRLLPFADILTEEALDLEFDYLQNSGFDIAEPLVIYHESADGNWVFGASRATSGWFLKADLAFVERNEWLAYQQARDFVVNIQDKSDLYLDEARTKYFGLIRMGSRLPVIAEKDAVFEVKLPDSRSAYIAKSAVHRGFADFTARNVYEFAFSTLNAPYGWGDLNAEYDCSGFIKQLFLCFGIYLPRNGTAQYNACHNLHQFSNGESSAEREEIIAELALPAQTLLRMQGHIMLYLGSFDGRNYALHSLWGIRRPGTNEEDEIITTAKTVVSDLSLGEGSKRKSLLLRLSGFGAIKDGK